MSQDKNLDDRVSIDNMADAYSTLIEGVGEDLTRDGLIDTPNRAAKAMKFLTKGYEQQAQAHAAELAEALEAIKASEVAAAAAEAAAAVALAEANERASREAEAAAVASTQRALHSRA